MKQNITKIWQAIGKFSEKIYVTAPTKAMCNQKLIELYPRPQNSRNNDLYPEPIYFKRII